MYHNYNKNSGFDWILLIMMIVLMLAIGIMQFLLFMALVRCPIFIRGYPL